MCYLVGPKLSWLYRLGWNGKNCLPGIREYPLTLECRVLYRQEQKLDLYSEKAMRFYPQDVGSENTGANKDPHVMYIGEIVNAYIIE